MAQRSVLTGIVAVGIAAAAMRVGNSGPSPQLSGSRGSAAPTSSRRHTDASDETMAKIDWTEDLKRHPKETGQRSAAKELDDAIADFYTPHGSVGQPASKPSSPAPCSDLEVMIAIEPDPAHTRLALWFDRDLDTLGDALQEGGYEYQANWMPWSAEGPSGAPGDRFLDREQQRLFFEGREQMPGVLLFRPAQTETRDHSCPPKFLEVFVVGNSPTSGVNGTQFREAIRQFARRSSQQEKLKILGPSFSGSGPSLRALIQEIPGLLTHADSSTASADSPPALKSIEIASGSITDPECSHFLPNPLPGDAGCSVITGNIKSNFVSFAPDSSSVIKNTEDFLMEPAHGDIDPSRIAVLTEDESNFGLNVRGVGKTTVNHSTARTTARMEERGKILNVTYPRGISHLRSAYQKSSIWGFGGTTEGSGSVNLNLDFDETTTDEDSVPVFARQQMPVSQESNVYQLTTLLRERGIQAVILSGTDVLDVIFVAQILARQAPNLLIVIWEADDLFLRSATNSVFRNVYFVGSWPLISEDYFWSLPAPKPGKPPATQFRNFVSDNAEGFHTAVHYLLRDRSTQNGQPIPDLPDYHSPFRPETRGHAPLWLCSEDHGRFWPIALLGENTSEAKGSNFHLPDLDLSNAPAGLDQQVPPPASQRFFLILLAMMSLAHLYFCLDRGLPMPQSIEAHYITNDKETRTPKLLLLLGISLLGLFMVALFLPPPARPSLLCASTAIPFAISMLCLSMTTTLLLSRLLAAPSKWAQMLLFLLVVAGTTSSWLILWRLLSHSTGPDGMSAFFAYRVTQALGGASPALPLFLASTGLAYVLYSHLGRLNFTNQLTPRLPENSASVPNIPKQGQCELVTSLLHYPPTPKQWIPKSLSLAVLSVTALVLCCAADVSPRVFDGRVIHFALEVLLSLVLLAILWDLAMASAIWSNLSAQILQPLENSSLRRAFNAIGGLTWKSFWMPQNSVSQYRAIFRLLEQADRKPLFPESEAVTPGGQNLHHKADALWKAYKTKPRMNPAVLQAFDDVQQSIQTIADSLIGKLYIHWNREVVSITAPDATPPEEDGKCPEKLPDADARHQAREEWVALVYLHFSRIVLAQVRSRLMTAAVLYFFLVWACTCYPFLNRHLILIALSVTLGILSAVGIAIFASINRDAVLSRVTKNTPGELDWDFLIKTASLIGIPILSFVATQFPELGSFLFSWIQPSMTSLK